MVIKSCGNSQPLRNDCRGKHTIRLTQPESEWHISLSVFYQAIIGSGDGLSPVRSQAIIWTNVGLLSIRPLGTNFSEILIKIAKIWIKKTHLEMALILSPLQCVKWVQITTTNISIRLATSTPSMISLNGNIFFRLLSLCAGNSQVTSEFTSQRPVKQSFDVFFDLCLHKWLSTQSRRWWFETPSCSLWRQCNEIRDIWIPWVCVM